MVVVALSELPVSWTLDTVGPITRTVRDTAIFLNAVAGHDPRDFSTSARPSENFTANLDDGIEGLRVGILEERSAVGAGVSFRFAHAFFRQTLYEEMFSPRRIRLHQQVGRTLEEVRQSVGEEYPLFYHIRQEQMRRERPLLMETLKAFAQGRVRVEGRQVVSSVRLNDEVERALGKG